MMTHREKVALVRSDLKRRGVNRFTIAPPMFRLLWALGIELPPPFFIPFLPLAVLLGVPFGTVMAVGIYLCARHFLLPSFIAVSFIAGVFVVAGASFGLITGGYFRWKAKSLNLPTWERYGTS
jgi:hypothetical protein